MGIRRLALLCLFVGFSVFSFAQKGTLKGLVTDQKSKEPLVGATIMLESTTTGTITDFDGNYELRNITPGTYAVRCSFISYETKSLPNIQIKAGQVIELNVQLGESTVEIGDVKVVAKANRESESMLLVQQKNSVIATQAIGAQEISRKGASDAEAAVAKVSGISKQEGVKNVFVRGLGDRFNATTLNGFPVPSEDPEYKNISLDFFASDIIKAVGVNKVFSAGATGDVAGAEINISSKELVGESDLNVSLSAGVNTQAVNKTFLMADGLSSFGFSAGGSQPSSISKYDYKNSLDPSSEDFHPNRGFAVAGGKRLLLGANKNPLNVYLIGTYSTDFSYTNGFVRSTGTTGIISRDQTRDKYDQSSSHLLMVNADYRIKKTLLTYNGMVIHSSVSSFADYFGKNSTFEDVADNGYLGLVRRQQVNDNTLTVNQLNSITELSDRNKLEAGVSYNMVKGNEPDRRINYLSYLSSGILSPTKGTGRQDRNFSELKENDLNAKLILNHKLSDDSNSRSLLSVGYKGRFLNDDFQATEYDNSRITQPMLDRSDFSLDALFNQSELDNNAFLQQKYEQSYKVDKYINTGFADLTYSLNGKLTADVGFRADKVNLKVTYNVNRGSTQGETKIDELYLLPSLNLKYELNGKNSLRFGASRTYTLPQSKEISPYRYDGPDWKSQGNPDLIPSINYNFDLKWDYYISSDELLSVTAFGKLIQDPISRIEIASAGGYLSYDNIADNATIGGAELEIRKNLFKSSNDDDSRSSKLSAGLNGSYILTDVTLRKDLNFTNSSSELEGAAPMIVNADLTYQFNRKDFSLTNSLVLNYFSDRIYTIGTQGYQDINEDGITTLDFISSAKLNKHWGLNLKAKNLLDPTFRLTRDPNGEGVAPIVLSSYKKGININFGISYTL